MNGLDWLLLVVALAEARRGAALGVVRSFFSLGGATAGVLLGTALAPFVGQLAAGTLNKLLLLGATIILGAVLGGAAGQALGGRLSRFTRRLRLTAAADSVSGAVFSATISLLLVWLLASVFSGMLPAGINQQVRGSAVLRNLDESLPPAPTLLAGLARFIGPLGFPEVFVGREPAPLEPVDAATAAEIAQAEAAAAASTVKIEGIGCGGLVSGSGFVAAPETVVTNAHVVAGINRPVVVDANGTHRATAIYFDPDVDLAILRVAGLAGPPLTIADDAVARGTSAVVLGYPAGGPRRAVAAGVLQRTEALGRDIYNQGLVTRQIYQLQTQIESGNSGGPLVLPDGRVIGAVFARSQTDAQIGYAITAPAIRNALDRARGAQPTATGRCAAA